MKTTIEWMDFMKLNEYEYFVISAELYAFERDVKKRTGISLRGAAHVTRRFEYPWAYMQAKKGEHCLDAGSGLNPFSFALSKYYKKITVLDFDKKTVQQMNIIKKNMT